MNDSDVAFLLNERVKELECHNRLSLLLSQANLELDDLLGKTAVLVINALQFPERARIKITLRDHVFQSPDYKETIYQLVLPVTINEESVGGIAVSYVEQDFPKPDAPFLEEEKAMLVSVALRIGKYIDIQEKDAALQKSETLYRSILRSSPDAVTITDLDGTIRMASPSANFLMGVDPNGTDLIGHNIFEFVLPEDRENALTAVQGIATKEKREPSAYRVVKMDGSMLEMESNADYIRDEMGIPFQMIVISRDVTDRNREARKLIESQNAYKDMVETINDVIFEVTMDATIKFVSPAIERMLGYKPEELIGQNFFRYMYPDDRESLLEALKQLGKKDYSYLEYRYINKSGSPYWVRSSTRALYENGIVVGGRGVIIDINEKRLSEQKILESSEALNMAQEMALMGSWELNLETMEEFWSENLYNIYEIDPIEKLSTQILFEKCLHPDDWEIYKQAERALFETKSRISVELRLLMPDGRIKWIQDDIIPYFREDKLVALKGLNIDITEKKHKDEALHELNTNLEKLVAERTEELAESNRKLLQEMEERNLIDEALRVKTEELEKFFSVSLDLLCIADLEGRFQKVNSSWGELLGYSTAELEGRLFLEFVHPDDMEDTLLEMGKLGENKKVTFFTNRYRTKDGQYRYIEWYSVPEGNRIYAAAHDVTERKKAEDFKNELLQLSAMLTGLPLAEIDAAIELSLQRIGTYLEADRSYIFEIDEPEDTMTNTYEWCNTGITSEIDNLKHLPCEIFPNWMAALHRGENIAIPMVSALSEEWSGERAILEPQGVQSIVVIPLFIESKLMGFVGLDSVHDTKTYSSSEVNTLRVWGSMLASLINRKKNENQLEQTRENLQTFFDTIDDILLVIDADENIIYANPSTCNILGYTQEEMLGKPVLNMHPEEDREKVHQVVWEILKGNKLNMTFPFLGKNGRLIPVETKIKRGFWNGVPATYAISKDLSDLQISEKKFSTAFHANPTMMIISRMRDGVYLEVNNTFVETLGYSAEELIGSTDKELHLMVDTEVKDQIIDRVSRGETIRKFEMQMRTKSGEIRTGLLSADSIYVGDEPCVLTVNIDITERKKAEIELMIARQEAELANLAKSEFLSRMSHELRTPMNSILGFAQLLEMGELNNSQRKGVNHILHSGKHLLDLINEVLDISRIEAGRLSLSLEPVEVESILQEALDIIHPLAVNNRLTIHKTTHPEKPLYVHSDHQRLKQILLNLLNNAVKYNKQGGSITVQAVQIPPIDGKPANIRMSISDTGIGILPENLSKIFEAFERVGAENSEQEGTGLGLSVAKKLVTALSGTIGVESEPGVGSTFWVEFQQSESPTDRMNQSNIEELNEEHLNGMVGTLLYVEDNDSNIELVEEILAIQHAGIKLITTKWGKEAYELASKYQPKLILLDLNLPDIHGEEALRQLLQNDDTRHIPVVVISADAMPRQTERLLQAGAKKFLTKPIDIPEFLKVVEQHFSV